MEIEFLRLLRYPGKAPTAEMQRYLAKLIRQRKGLLSPDLEEERLVELLREHIAWVRDLGLIEAPRDANVLRIVIGNPHAMDGRTEIATMIETWKSAQELFSDYLLPMFGSQDQCYRVTLDVRELVEELSTDWEHDRVASENRIVRSIALGYKAYIDIRFADLCIEIDDYTVLRSAARFLQNLFIAMNLSMPGSCNLYDTSYRDVHLDYVANINLIGHKFEDAWIEASNWGWPHLERIPLPQVWEWLCKINEFLQADRASSPLENALFSLLVLGDENGRDEDHVLLIARMLEGLLIQKPIPGIASGLRERIESILGSPQSHKGWLGKFYDLRSRVAHGEAMLVRAGGIHSDDLLSELDRQYYTPIKQGTAVLLALLQDLIVSGSVGYAFPQTVVRHPLGGCTDAG